MKVYGRQYKNQPYHELNYEAEAATKTELARIAPRALTQTEQYNKWWAIMDDRYTPILREFKLTPDGFEYLTQEHAFGSED